MVLHTRLLRPGMGISGLGHKTNSCDLTVFAFRSGILLPAHNYLLQNLDTFGLSRREPVDRNRFRARALEQPGTRYPSGCRRTRKFNYRKTERRAIWFSRVQRFQQNGAVCKVLGERIKCYGKHDGLPLDTGNALAEDTSGNLWFGDPSTVVRWNGSSVRTFSPQGLEGNRSDGVTGIAAAPDGSVWLGFAIRGTRPGPAKSRK